MKKTHEITEKLWEYVHGEADTATKATIDEALSQDPHLRTELDAIKTIDKNLAKLVPLLKVSEQDLEDRIMTALEQNPPASTREVHASKPRVIFHNFRSILATPWLQYGSLVAAAATILLLFSMYHSASAPIRWTEPQVVPLQYRGAAHAEQAGAYTAQQLTECTSSIEDAIARAYAAESRQLPGRALKWALSCRIKELPASVLCIQIRAHESGRFVREWTHYYGNLKEFNADLSSMAAKTATDLLSFAPGNLR
jgi:hypothetical protein